MPDHKSAATPLPSDETLQSIAGLPPHLPGDPRRQAVFTIQGTVYQAWWSIDAWLQLTNADNAIYLEGAEDFDIVKHDTAITVQVKQNAGSVSLGTIKTLEVPLFHKSRGYAGPRCPAPLRSENQFRLPEAGTGAQFVQTLSDMQHGAEIPATLPALLQQRLCHLTNLTPGDFAVVIRQSLMLGHHFHADNLVVASEEESPVRSGIQPNRSVAFCVRQDG